MDLNSVLCGSSKYKGNTSKMTKNDTKTSRTTLKQVYKTWNGSNIIILGQGKHHTARSNFLVGAHALGWARNCHAEPLARRGVPDQIRDFLHVLSGTIFVAKIVVPGYRMLLTCLRAHLSAGPLHRYIIDFWMIFDVYATLRACDTKVHDFSSKIVEYIQWYWRIHT